VALCKKKKKKTLPHTPISASTNEEREREVLDLRVPEIRDDTRASARHGIKKNSNYSDSEVRKRQVLKRRRPYPYTCAGAGTPRSTSLSGHACPAAACQIELLSLPSVSCYRPWSPPPGPGPGCIHVKAGWLMGPGGLRWSRGCLAFTGYCHHQYCMVHGIHKGGRWGGVYCAMVEQ